MNPAFVTDSVKPLDRGTFLVSSLTSPGKEYLVDLTSYYGAGCCSCPDYRCRHEPKNATLGPTAATTPHRCRHIKLVRSYVADLATMGLMRVDGTSEEAF